MMVEYIVARRAQKSGMVGSKKRITVSYFKINNVNSVLT